MHPNPPPADCPVQLNPGPATERLSIMAQTHDLANRSKTLQESTTQEDYILVDGSGSMSLNWTAVNMAIDSYIVGLQANNIRSHVTLSVFDSDNIDNLQRDEMTDDWHDCKTWPLQLGGGMTPLYDAINIMARKLRDLNPSRCSILIVTDGDDSGAGLTETQARAILDWCRAKGWQVTFIGCDWNNERLAKKLGGPAAAAIGVQKASLSDAAKSLATKRARYSLYGDQMHFSEDERTQFGGLLAKPEAKS